MKTLLKITLSGLLLSFIFNTVKAQYMVNGKKIDTTFNHQINQVFGNMIKAGYRLAC